MARHSIPIENGAKQWIDLVNPSAEELGALAKTYSLHPAHVLDCLDANHLPKFDETDHARFIIVRAFDEECPTDAATAQALTRKIAIFVTSGAVLTVHRMDQSFLVRLRQLWESKGAERSQAYLVNQLLSESMRTYLPLAERVGQQLDVLEDRIFHQTDTDCVLDTIYQQKRVTTVVERLVRMTEDIAVLMAPLRGADVPFAKEIGDQIRSILFAFDDLQSRMDNMVQLHLAIASQRNNDVIRVLTLFSAFFLPLTFLVGVYGMNFRYMPELEWRVGYPAALSLMAVVAAGIWIWFKKKGWLR